MQVPGKKAMKAKLVMDPMAEMKRPVLDWVKNTPLFVKKFKPVKFEETISLDPRKWSEKKLEKELYQVVKFNLQLFATQGADFKKDVDKKGPLGQQTAERQYPKLYEKLVKHAGNKISMALEELEANKKNSTNEHMNKMHARAIKDMQKNQCRQSTKEQKDLSSCE